MGSLGRLLSANQILIDGISVVIRRSHGFDLDVVEGQMIQLTVEPVGVARLHEQTSAVRKNLRRHDVFLLENARGKRTRTVAANQNLHGMLLNFRAHAVNLSFRHHIAARQQNDAVGNQIHFVQDMAGNDDVTALVRNSAIVSARTNGSSPFSGSSSTSTFGSWAIACASLMRCRMPLL